MNNPRIESVFNAALEKRDLHGERHVSNGITLTRLGRLLRDKGDDVGAERALREGLEITKDLPGSGRFASSDTRFELAQLLSRRGKLAEAETLLRDTIRLRREQGSNDGYLTGTALEQLTFVLTSQGKYDDAEQALLETFEAFSPLFAPDSVRIGTLNAGCGLWFRQQAKPETAEPYLREAIRIYRANENPPRDYYLAALDGLFQIIRRHDDTTEEAISVFLECMENMTYVYGPDHLLVAPHFLAYANALEARGRDADAIPLLIEGIRLFHKAKGEEWEDGDERFKQLEKLTRRVALAAGLSNEQYQAALQGATVLSSNTTRSTSDTGLSGIIHYRCGHYDEALRCLTASDQLLEDTTSADASDGMHEILQNLMQERAFLAMTQFQLGESEAARGTLVDLRELLNQASFADDDRDLVVVAEAEALISTAEKGG